MERAHATARDGTKVPLNVLEAIYGDRNRRDVVEDASIATSTSTSTTTTRTTSTTRTKDEEKKQRYDDSLAQWWKTYSERKNDEEEEHVADSLLYDYRHLPRTTPGPNYAEDRAARASPREDARGTTSDG